MRLTERGMNNLIEKIARNNWNQKANGSPLCQRKWWAKPKRKRKAAMVPICLLCHAMLYAVCYYSILVEHQIHEWSSERKRRKKGTKNIVDSVSFDTLILSFEHVPLCSALLLFTYLYIYHFWTNLFGFFPLLLLLLCLHGSGNSICFMFIFDLDK